MTHRFSTDISDKMRSRARPERERRTDRQFGYHEFKIAIRANRDKPRQGVVANTLNLSPNGAVGFIVRSGNLISAVVAKAVRFQSSSNLR